MTKKEIGLARLEETLEELEPTEVAVREELEPLEPPESQHREESQGVPDVEVSAGPGPTPQTAAEMAPAPAARRESSAQDAMASQGQVPQVTSVGYSIPPVPVRYAGSTIVRWP